MFGNFGPLGIFSFPMPHHYPADYCNRRPWYENIEPEAAPPAPHQRVAAHVVDSEAWWSRINSESSE